MHGAALATAPVVKRQLPFTRLWAWAWGCADHRAPCCAQAAGPAVQWSRPPAVRQGKVEAGCR